MAATCTSSLNPTLLFSDEVMVSVLNKTFGGSTDLGEKKARIGGCIPLFKGHSSSCSSYIAALLNFFKKTRERCKEEDVSVRGNQC